MPNCTERSRTVWASLGAIAVLASAPLSAQSGTLTLDAAPGSSLTIRGSTTIGKHWHCASTDIASSVTLSVEPGANSDARVTSVRRVTIRVAVASLRCQSGGMERAMRHAMRADQDSGSTVIVGEFTGQATSVVHPTEPSSTPLDGTLKVAGVERAVVLAASVIPQPDGSIRVQTSVPLALSMFTISPPSVLFGAVRARDAITIEVDLRFTSPE